MQDYRTISGTACASLVEKKSEFIANVSAAQTEQEALAFLERIRAQHRTAAHHVYAYVLREGARMRHSDDGEPAKTAGLPTLDAMIHAQLTDCIVVTTRYFGGTLLGTGGLVRAYAQAAKLALAAAQQVSMRVCVRGVLRISYAEYEQAARLMAAAGARVQAPQFADIVSLPFMLLAGTQQQLLVQLQALCRGAVDLELSSPCYACF